LGIRPQVEFEIVPSIAATVDPDLVGVIRRHPNIDYIEPEQPIEFRTQIKGWNIVHVNADVAWSRSTGAGQRLLIIDTGVGEHPDLHVTVYHACDNTFGRDVNDNWKWGHGTAVAGVAAALNNTISSVGVAHGVELWSSRAFTVTQFVCAMQFARMNGVFSINLSGGFATSSAAVTDQINGAWNQGLMFFTVGDIYPGTLASAIGVNGVNASNQRVSGGGSGPGVELVAPGQGVPSSNVKTGSITLYDGDSFAVPHVSAAAAILKAYHPSWTNQRIRRALRETAIDLGAPGRDDTYGYDLLHIDAALSHVIPPPPVVTIEGPTVIQPGATCTWDAVVTSVDPPYSYYWWGETMPSGTTGPSITAARDPAVLGPQFKVRVSVSNAGGSTTGEVTVQEDSNAMICIM
jgi:subtilisin family serine protease